MIKSPPIPLTDIRLPLTVKNMIKFYNATTIRTISTEEVESIRTLAQEGDPVACFKLGRMTYAWSDLSAQEDYLITTKRLLTQAQRGGVVEADVALAIMMLNGEIEPYNPRRALGMIEEALKKGNEYAAYNQLCNLIFARFGYKQDLDLAERMLDELMEHSTNPWFYDLKGEVLQARGRYADSELWFAKAVECGITFSYNALAYARGYDNNGELRDWNAFIKTQCKGADEGNMFCMHYFAENQMQEYDSLGPEQTEKRDECRSNILELLEECVDQKHGFSAETLGDIYRGGLYGVPVDYDKAWRCYMLGADYALGNCYEKLYDMIVEGQVERATDRQECLEQFAIYGARLRNRRMQEETVRMYRCGRMTHYAAEIEMYHMPEVEKRYVL